MISDESDGEDDNLNVGLNVEVENTPDFPSAVSSEKVVIKMDTGLEFHSYIKLERRSSSEETTSDGRLGSARKRKQNRPIKTSKNVLENFAAKEDIKDPTLLKAFTKNAPENPTCDMKGINPQTISESNLPKPKPRGWGSRWLKRAQPYGMPFDASTRSLITADTSQEHKVKKESQQDTVSVNNPYHTNQDRNSFQLNKNFSSDHLFFSSLTRTCVQRYRQKKDAEANEKDIKKIQVKNTAKFRRKGKIYKVQNPSSVPRKGCVRMLPRKRSTATNFYYKRKCLESPTSGCRGRPPTRGRPRTRGRPPTRDRPPIRGRPPTRGRPSIRGRHRTRGRPPKLGGDSIRGRPPTRGGASIRGSHSIRGRRPTRGKPSTFFQKDQSSRDFFVLKDEIEFSPKQNLNLQCTDADINQSPTNGNFRYKQQKEPESDGRDDSEENPFGICSKSRFANVESSGEMDRDSVGLISREGQKQLRRDAVTKKYQFRKCFLYTRRRKRRSCKTCPAQTSFKDIRASEEQQPLQPLLVKAKLSNVGIPDPTHSSPMLSDKSQESQNQSLGQQKKLPCDKQHTLQNNDEYNSCSIGIRYNRVQKEDEFSHVLQSKNFHETIERLYDDEDITELNGDNTEKSENWRQLECISFTNMGRGSTYTHSQSDSNHNDSIVDSNRMSYNPEQRRTELFNLLQKKYRHKNTIKLNKDGDIIYMDEDNIEKSAISTQPEVTSCTNTKGRSPYRVATPQSSSNTDDSEETFSSGSITPEKRADLSHLLQSKNHYKNIVKLEKDGDIMEVNEDNNAERYIFQRQPGYISCTSPMYEIGGRSRTYPSNNSNTDDSEVTFSSMSSNLEDYKHELLHMLQSKNLNKTREPLNKDRDIAEPNKDNAEKFILQKQPGHIFCTRPMYETSGRPRTYPYSSNNKGDSEVTSSSVGSNLEEYIPELYHLLQSKNLNKTKDALNEDRDIVKPNEDNAEKSASQRQTEFISCTSKISRSPPNNTHDSAAAFSPMNYNIKKDKTELSHLFQSKSFYKPTEKFIEARNRIQDLYADNGEKSRIQRSTTSNGRGRPHIYHQGDSNIDDYETSFRELNYNREQNKTQIPSFLQNKELGDRENSEIPQANHIPSTSRKRGRPRIYPLKHSPIDDHDKGFSGTSNIREPIESQSTAFLQNKELNKNEKSGVSKHPENISSGSKRRGRPRKYPQTDSIDRVFVTRNTREVSTQTNTCIINNTCHCVCHIKKTRDLSTQTNIHIVHFDDDELDLF